MSDDLRDPNKAVDKNAEAPTNKVKFAAESVANTPINRASNVKIAQRPMRFRHGASLHTPLSWRTSGMSELNCTGAPVKRCSKCQTEKPHCDFSKRRLSKDGVRSECKACAKIASATYYAENSEQVLARNAAWSTKNIDKARAAEKAWREANRERKKATNAAWGAANPSKVKAKSSTYRATHPERVKRVRVEWALANPQKLRIINQNRRARARAVGGKLSPDLAVKLFKLQQGLCPCCKQPLGDDYHLDHIVPLILGGSNTDDNIQLLRQRCNNQKHAKHPVDFMQERGFLL